MSGLKEITCDCSVADKCPNGSLGSERRCQILIDEDKILNGVELVYQIEKLKIMVEGLRSTNKSLGVQIMDLTKSKGLSW